MALNQDIRLICFDLDGTLLANTVFIWSTLHDHFGSDPKRRMQAAQDHFAGRITYAEWFHTDLELLIQRGANRKRLIEAFQGLTPAPGAPECLQSLHARGYRLGLISGSLNLALEHFFPQAPFHHVLINQIHFDEQGNIAGGMATPYDLEGKAKGLEELARRESIQLSHCAFVGDNTNDLAAMQAAGYSVGVNIKNEKVARVADVVIQDSDLRRLLPMFPGPPPRI